MKQKVAHYVILAYFVFTFPVMMPELLSLILGARDTNKLISFPQTNQLANSNAISRHLYLFSNN